MHVEKGNLVEKNNMPTEPNMINRYEKESIILCHMHAINFISFISPPNVQAELRGLTIFRMAAVSSSLWLGGSIYLFFNVIHGPLSIVPLLRISPPTKSGQLSRYVISPMFRSAVICPKIPD